MKNKKSIQKVTNAPESLPAPKPKISANSPEGRGTLALIPSINNGSVIESFQANVMGKDAELAPMVETLEFYIKQVKRNDLSHLEAMLVGQATALQTIFTSLARRAASQTHLRHYEAFMGLALKAQSQSRSTVTAIADLKSPRQATFVGQANLTTGPQQINNSTFVKQSENQNTPNQLSGKTHELRKNPGTQSLEGGIDKAMEAMEKINRAKVSRRKETLSHEGFERPNTALDALPVTSITWPSEAA